MYPASNRRTVVHRPGPARVDGASADSGTLIPPRTEAPRGAGCHAEGVGDVSQQAYDAQVPRSFPGRANGSGGRDEVARQGGAESWTRAPPPPLLFDFKAFIETV